MPKTLLTPEQYLAREAQAEFKSEYFAGETFAMAGGTRAHSIIGGNTTTAFQNALGGKGCRPFNSDLRVKIDDTGLYTYPDASVVCGEARIERRGGAESLLNPTLIVEVLSDSTEQYDRTVKFDHYRKLESLREYVLVSQHQPRVERFVCEADGSWTYHVHEGLDAVATFAAIPAMVPLSNIYLDVAFPEPIPTLRARREDA